MRAMVLFPLPLSPTRLTIWGGLEVRARETSSTATSSPPIWRKAAPRKTWLTPLSDSSARLSAAADSPHPTM